MKDVHVSLLKSYNWVFYQGLECPRTTKNRKTKKEMVEKITESKILGKTLRGVRILPALLCGGPLKVG
jgi:hypothetical protein